ncbi:MAG: hypothetical protein M3423_04545 [Actinomycetota bacterium]|nr:hypothetical protein [Nocardioidaceae bacterium]MDQ3480584.1 hypothetical protein [Actinomycetota bacterium]
MSKPYSHTRALFTRLFDDAAMFPPGSASAADAVTQHLEHRSTDYADLVGPLLVHVDRWGEFATAHRQAGSPELDVVIIGSASAEPVDTSGIAVVGHEVAAPLRSPEAGSHRPVAVELAPQGALEQNLTELARMRQGGAPVIGKFRTGGTSLEAFPSQTQLANLICSTVDHGVPVKFTAGLHHALRHTDETTGFDHHGFLNIAVAIRAAHLGFDAAEASMILGIRDSEALVGQVAAWTRDDIATVRSTFTSFGCCGVRDPIAEAAALGLLSQESA